MQSLFIAIFEIMNSLNGLKHEKGQNKNKNFRHSTTLMFWLFKVLTVETTDNVRSMIR